MLDRDCFETCTAPPEARKLEIEDERIEGGKRPAVRIGKAELLDLEHERERIEADLTELDLASVVPGRERERLRVHDARHDKETRDGIDRHEHGEHRSRHNEFAEGAHAEPAST
jgi:hypothetical protein